MRKPFPLKPVVILRVAVIAALSALVIWGVWTHIITRDRPATITAVFGTVLYSPAGDPQWVTARRGLPLHRGDQLLTQPPDGAVTVQFDDGNIGFRLEADTLVTLTARWNSLLPAGIGGLYLSHGALMAETRPDVQTSQTRFCIDTEAAQVTLESTRLIVQVLKEEPTIRISLLKGEVRVRAKPAQAALYRTDAQRLPERETVVTANETLIVYVEPQALAAPAFDSNLGRVVDPQTRGGVEGMVVQVIGDPGLFAVTDEDGYFDIQGAAFNSELMVVGTTEEMAGELELRPSVGLVSGRVVDAATHQGVGLAQIIPVGHPSLATETGTDGSFTIQELPAGTHSLTVVAEGYVSPIAEATITTRVLVSLPDIRVVPMDEDELEPMAWLPIVFRQYGQYP